MVVRVCRRSTVPPPPPPFLSCLQPELLRKCQVSNSAPKVGSPLHRVCLLCSGVLPNVAEDCPLAAKAVSHASRGPGHKPPCKPGVATHASTVTTEDVLIHQRLYSALLLYRVTFEEPVPLTAARFGVPVGSLEQLQRNAYSFAGEDSPPPALPAVPDTPSTPPPPHPAMVDQFCEQLSWKFFVGVWADIR